MLQAAGHRVDGVDTALYPPMSTLFETWGIPVHHSFRPEHVLDAEPEEGKPAQVAEAMDAAEKARKTARKTEKVATKAAEGARKAKEKLDAAASENKTDPEKIAIAGQAFVKADCSRFSPTKAVKRKKPGWTQ